MRLFGRAKKATLVRAIYPLADFLRQEALSGLIVIACIIAALAWANGPWSASYHSLWNTHVSLGVNEHQLSMTLRHWVNDVLMALFFFVIGLELKREIAEGDLRDRRKLAVPLLGAIGGMIVPAIIFLAFTLGTPDASGWGVPMATDTGIALGVIALLQTDTRMKMLLLTIAIVDDVGAILLLATVYAVDAISWAAIGVAVALLAAFWFLRRNSVSSPALYLALGVATWFAVKESGLHTTLAGVALALLTPAQPLRRPEYIDAEDLADISSFENTVSTITLARDSVSRVDWLQHLLHPWTSYVILPIFALANAGIVVNASEFSALAFSNVSLGIAIGLAVGKPVGITFGAWCARRVFGAKSTLNQRGIFGVGLLAGIGFTMSVFIAEIAFGGSRSLDAAKMGVLLGSLLAGVAGYIYLRHVPNCRDTHPCPDQ